MQFYDDALIILQRPCGDPLCGLLHPEIIDAEFIGVVIHENEALVAVVQKKPAIGGPEVYVALILEPTSVGYLTEQNNRLCVVITENEIREPMMMAHPDADEMKKTLAKDEQYLHGALFGRIKVPGDDGYEGELPPSEQEKPAPMEEVSEQDKIESAEETPDDPTGLAKLDPNKMHQA